MARTLLSGAHIVYGGDPLRDHALVTFLDKFLLKKPKQPKAAAGAAAGQSVMQPGGGQQALLGAAAAASSVKGKGESGCTLLRRFLCLFLLPLPILPNAPSDLASLVALLHHCSSRFHRLRLEWLLHLTSAPPYNALGHPLSCKPP